MTNVLAMFRLIPAIQIVYRYGVELTEQDFQELTPEQYDAYRRKVSPKKERVYRLVLVEPSVIERTAENVTFELEIVSEHEKAQLFEAIDFIRKSSSALDNENPSFKKRLKFLKTIWPREVTGGS